MTRNIAYLILAATLAGCATAPTGPHIAVMPAPGKPFELFIQDEQTCRNYAQQSSSQTQDEAAQRFAKSAAAGTAIGAVAGTLGGGRDGTSEGAAAGLVTGTMVGAGESMDASWDAQRRYDIAYAQCMYAKGNQVPGFPQPQYIPPPPPPR